MKLVVATEAALFAAPAFKAERAVVVVRNSVADMISAFIYVGMVCLGLNRLIEGSGIGGVADQLGFGSSRIVGLLNVTADLGNIDSKRT